MKLTLINLINVPLEQFQYPIVDNCKRIVHDERKGCC